MNAADKSIERLKYCKLSWNYVGKKTKFSENIFAVCMFSATVACVWQAVSMAFSLVTNFN